MPVTAFKEIDLGDAITYSAKLANGNALPSWLMFDPSTHAFSGTAASAQIGTLNISLLVTDKSGASVSQQFALIVRPNGITGTANNDNLTGTSGDNTIDGGTGADKLIGLAGNDTYVADNVGDTVVEAANAGTDLVKSGVSYTLAVNVENLTLTGTTAINATGNELANVITGNSGNNTLDGKAGADTLAGGAGNDILSCGIGNDTVIFGKGDGQDVLQGTYDITPGKLNTLQFKAGILANEVRANRSGNDLLLSINATADRVKVQSFFYGNTPNNNYNPLQQTKFADGTVWNTAAIFTKVNSIGNTNKRAPLSESAVNQISHDVTSISKISDASDALSFNSTKDQTMNFPEQNLSFDMYPGALHNQSQTALDSWLRALSMKPHLLKNADDFDTASNLAVTPTINQTQATQQTVFDFSTQAVSASLIDGDQYVFGASDQALQSFKPAQLGALDQQPVFGPIGLSSMQDKPLAMTDRMSRNVVDSFGQNALMQFEVTERGDAAQALTLADTWQSTKPDQLGAADLQPVFGPVGLSTFQDKPLVITGGFLRSIASSSGQDGGAWIKAVDTTTSAQWTSQAMQSTKPAQSAASGQQPVFGPDELSSFQDKPLAMTASALQSSAASVAKGEALTFDAIDVAPTPWPSNALQSTKPARIDSQVQSLLQAMASFGPEAAGHTSMVPVAKQSTEQLIATAGWDR